MSKSKGFRIECTSIWYPVAAIGFLIYSLLWNLILNLNFFFFIFYFVIRFTFSWRNRIFLTFTCSWRFDSWFWRMCANRSLRTFFSYIFLATFLRWLIFIVRIIYKTCSFLDLKFLLNFFFPSSRIWMQVLFIFILWNLTLWPYFIWNPILFNMGLSYFIFKLLI